MEEFVVPTIGDHSTFVICVTIFSRRLLAINKFIIQYGLSKIFEILFKNLDLAIKTV